MFLYDSIVIPFVGLHCIECPNLSPISVKIRFIKGTYVIFTTPPTPCLINNSVLQDSQKIQEYAGDQVLFVPIGVSGPNKTF